MALDKAGSGAITIRRPSPTSSSDIEAICRVGRESYKATFSWLASAEDMEKDLSKRLNPSYIQNLLASGTHPTWCAEQPTAGVIGFVIARTDNPESLELDPAYPQPVELQRLYVSYGHHNAGVGRKLVEAVHDWAKDQGYESVWLGVSQQNPKALRFYQKLGYKRIGEHAFTWSSGQVNMDDIMAVVL